MPNRLVIWLDDDTLARVVAAFPATTRTGAIRAAITAGLDAMPDSLRFLCSHRFFRSAYQMLAGRGITPVAMQAREEIPGVLRWVDECTVVALSSTGEEYQVTVDEVRVRA